MTRDYADVRSDVLQFCDVALLLPLGSGPSDIFGERRTLASSLLPPGCLLAVPSTVHSCPLPSCLQARPTLGAARARALLAQPPRAKPAGRRALVPACLGGAVERHMLCLDLHFSLQPHAFPAFKIRQAHGTGRLRGRRRRGGACFSERVWASAVVHYVRMYVHRALTCIARALVRLRCLDVLTS